MNSNTASQGKVCDVYYIEIMCCVISDRECIGMIALYLGIHTDGVDRAALVCLKRENINGCENSIHYDLAGNKNVLDPFVLEEGNVLYWKDNKVYHYVNPASLINTDKEGIRTMILLHYPAIFVVTGETNTNNTLGRKVFERNKQLRNQQK